VMTRSKTKKLQKEKEEEKTIGSNQDHSNETKNIDLSNETPITSNNAETNVNVENKNRSNQDPPNDINIQNSSIETPTTANIEEITNFEIEERPEIENNTEQEDMDTTQDYSTINVITKTLSGGYLSLKDFKQAQSLDTSCNAIIEKDNKPKHYSVKGELLFYKDKIVLPSVLYDIIINTKHFSIFGSHFSATKIINEVKRHYHLIGDTFSKKVFSITHSCYLCQIYNTNIKAHVVQKLPEVTSPRQSWSIDLVTDTPTSKLGNTQILVCVDDFSSYVICIPLITASSTNIINALKNHVFSPFGIPKIIRSDEQASIYNSNEFFQFLDNLGVTLTATAVAAPFSNARAESQIKNIKHLLRKFLFQQNNINSWDEEISILTSVQNRTPGAYTYAPEEIMFGTRNPLKTDLLTISEPTNNVTNYMEHILTKAESIRDNAKIIMDNKKKTNQTFKNKSRTVKQFVLGDLVLHRQMQVSTGSSSKWKPLFTGPYIIRHIHEDNSTAMIENIANRKEIKAHFTNLQKLDWNPNTVKFNDQFDRALLDIT
ncbi:integrase catalytic domain-containing protein, partial [Aeromonas sobria]|uniref:integrase catalytic domain-containing protein n=1 Tax=Aeromonas sobria TaxID=646 RepID=UPI003F2E00C6